MNSARRAVRTAGAVRRRVSVVALALAVTACVSVEPPPRSSLEAARAQVDAEAPVDDATLGRAWLLELVAPGGEMARATKLRARLGDRGGLWPSLARALDDEARGALPAAAGSFIRLLEAARTHDGPEAELLAWHAVVRLRALRASVPGLWAMAERVVDEAIADPRRVGFRARGELVDWWVQERRQVAGADRARLEAEAAARLGCAPTARFAGPFGRGAAVDVVTAFEAERPGTWPHAFVAESPSRAVRTLASENAGLCGLRAVSSSGDGVHYVETFFELDDPTDVVVVVQGAFSVRIDDAEILARDPRSFGVWPRFGAAARLGAGRHRLVARLGSDATSIRLVDRTGLPIRARFDVDPSRPYTLAAPELLPDPNALAPMLRAAGVAPAPAWPAPPTAFASLDTDDPALRFVAAELATLEGQGDLASVLFEPLVRELDRATPLALVAQAAHVEADPIFARHDARDLALDLLRRARDRDERLWRAQQWLARDLAQKQGDASAVAELRELVARFPEVPQIGLELAALLARLGYVPEQRALVVELEGRFPNDPDVRRAALAVHDAVGRFEAADRAADALARLEPGAFVEVERALVRGELAEAARRIAARADANDGRSRERLLRRADDLLVRAGRREPTIAWLERALDDASVGVDAHLSLADAQLAAGDSSALRRAVARAIRGDRDTTMLRDAIELVEGATELDPYRRDARAMIAEYEARGAHREDDPRARGNGTAARVLDYAALVIHRDGSARMLEHEILHMRSREAIQRHAEQRLPRGTLLRIRTIKADGTTFEPEVVAGKPTVTMPHLEVGDYVETETIYELSGSRGQGWFLAPRWFFREEKIDYFRSELVVVAPADRALEVEATGDVPSPSVETLGEVAIRTWRVERSPALPEEPASAPVSEFLPSVRVGYGVREDEVLRRLLDVSVSLAPTDPRLVRIAQAIASGGATEEQQASRLAASSREERARRLYRWVLDNVEPGDETDPRRVVTSKRGSRLDAFLYLARLAGIDARHAVVRDRLEAHADGPFAAAERWSNVAVAIPPERPGAPELWTVVGDRYAPFGYLPSSLRGQPAVVLRPGLPRVTTATQGERDGVEHDAEVELAADGSAKIHLTQRYHGKLGFELREAIEPLSDDELHDAVETRIVGAAIPGARLASMRVEHRHELDAPLELVLEVEASAFARRQGDRLVLTPPFAARFGRAITLERRETPLLLVGGIALRVASRVRIRAPRGARLVDALTPVALDDDGRTVRIDDRLDGEALVLDRLVDIPASRVAPDAYPRFVAFARAAETALDTPIVLQLP